MRARHARSLSVAGCATVAACLACSSAEHGGGNVAVQISGEAAATAGFSFPTGSDVTFEDGWQLRFSHVLVTVADVTLSENPDKAPADQAQTDAAVARADGPWAVDLVLGGSALPAGGEGSAVPLTRIDDENLRGGDAFAPDRRYAFGYRLVRASAGAAHVNFAGEEDAEALYARMIEEGDAVLYAGTATFVGTDCVASDAAYDFSALPSVVPFELGFATPTSYLNCQNAQNQGQPFEGEDYQRGIAVLPNQPALAQITLHLEHPFFSDTVHDSPLYFDQMAARFAAGAERPLATADLAPLDPTGFTDLSGAALPWRDCPHAGSTTLPPPGRQRGFGVGHTLVDPKGNPAGVFRNYGDFVAYVQSTQGHLNGGDGLCYVARDYPSPE
jgi:hypothetical protein